MKIDKKNILKSIFYPRKSSVQLDEMDKLVTIDTGINVGIRLFIKDKQAPTILYFHANAEITNEYDDFASLYHHYGINLIVAGYRGYGHSNGEPNMDNLHNDSLLIFEYVKKHLIDNSINGSLFIMGRSLGSAAAAHIIHNKLNDLDGCIIESGFATEIPLLSLININPKDINFKLEDGFQNLMKFKRYVKPLLVIHGELDDIIPLSQADMIMIETKTINKKIFKVEGAGHNDLISVAREHYFSNIRDFIENI